MRFRSLAMAALVAFALTAPGTPVAGRSARPTGRAAERALIEQLAPQARVTRDDATGTVRAIRGGGRPIATARSLGGPATPTAAARAFLGRYGTLVGVASPGRQLRVARVDRTGGTGTYVHYRQHVGGVPVLGGDVVVVVDGRMNVQAVRGEATRDTTVDTRARIPPGSAMRAAREAVARATGVPASRLRAARPTRWIYDPRLLDGPGLPYARLVWRTSVTDGDGLLDWFVAVDARSGDVALRFNQLAAGMPETAAQRICNQKGNRESTPGWDALPCPSSGPLVAPDPGTGEVLAARLATQATYDLYRLRFGHDLASELGGTLISTVRYCPRPAGGDCPFYNAFWNGSQMVYGTGFASADDVVAHELTHGVTERASNLFYYMESGAINEALSDIFGESVDLTDGIGVDTDEVRWRMGEDLPALVGVVRNMQDPTEFGHPDSMDSTWWEEDPSETDQGGVHANSGVANRAFYLMVEGGTPLAGDRDTALDKALAIWFRASQSLLTTASDYDDLATSLLIACEQLAGEPGAVKAANGTASEDIAAADCAGPGAVQAAIAATHMSWDERTTGTKPAPLCSDPDAVPDFTDLLNDPIDEPGTGWSFDSLSGQRWYTWDIYGFPAGGSPPGTAPWHLWGADRATIADRRVRRAAVDIPAAGRPVFLWFRHAYGFDDGSEDLTPNNRAYDGGVVEVSANGGPFRDIRSLFLQGGPTRRIWSGDANPLKGRIAFGAESRGYVTARANLSGRPGLSFAGDSARLSFRIGTDSAYAGEGWFIDDVRIYTCVNEADTTGPSVAQPAVSLATGAMSAAGAVPVEVTTTLGGDGFIASLVTAGAATVGGAVKGETVTGTLPTSDVLQSVTWTATDENGDQGSELRDILARRMEQSSFSFDGTWRTQTGGTFSGGSTRWSAVAGRTASVSVTGTEIALIAPTGPDRGKARLCLDGTQCRVVDLYSATLTPRRLVATWRDSSPGSHTVSVKVLGTRNARSSGKRVDVDALVVIDQ